MFVVILYWFFDKQKKAAGVFDLIRFDPIRFGCNSVAAIIIVVFVCVFVYVEVFFITDDATATNRMRYRYKWLDNCNVYGDVVLIQWQPEESGQCIRFDSIRFGVVVTVLLQ